MMREIDKEKCQPVHFHEEGDVDVKIEFYGLDMENFDYKIFVSLDILMFLNGFFSEYKYLIIKMAVLFTLITLILKVISIYYSFLGI